MIASVSGRKCLNFENPIAQMTYRAPNLAPAKAVQVETGAECDRSQVLVGW